MKETKPPQLISLARFFLKLCQRLTTQHDLQATCHFSQTADLLHKLTEDYRAVYSHLADGAEQLCGDRVSIINCEIHGNGNGIFAFGEPYKFVRPPGAPAETTNLVLQANYIHSNGVAGSDQMQ